MQLLTSEQIREIEEREHQKLIQEEIKQQQIREAEMRRREDERKALDQLREQQRQNVEPLYQLATNLKENEYLVMQYLNIGGKVATYKFKARQDTRDGDYWIGFTSEYEPFVSNGKNRNKILMSNILGLEVRVEEIAEVIEVQGVKYKRLIVDEPVDTIIQGQVKTYKGDIK